MLLIKYIMQASFPKMPSVVLDDKKREEYKRAQKNRSAMRAKKQRRSGSSISSKNIDNSLAQPLLTAAEMRNETALSPNSFVANSNSCPNEKGRNSNGHSIVRKLKMEGLPRKDRGTPPRPPPRYTQVSSIGTAGIVSEPGQPNMNIRRRKSGRNSNIIENKYPKVSSVTSMSAKSPSAGLVKDNTNNVTVHNPFALTSSPQFYHDDKLSGLSLLDYDTENADKNQSTDISLMNHAGFEEDRGEKVIDRIKRLDEDETTKWVDTRKRGRRKNSTT